MQQTHTAVASLHRDKTGREKKGNPGTRRPRTNPEDNNTEGKKAGHKRTHTARPQVHEESDVQIRRSRLCSGGFQGKENAGLRLPGSKASVMQDKKVLEMG